MLEDFLGYKIIFLFQGADRQRQQKNSGRLPKVSDKYLKLHTVHLIVFFLFFFFWIFLFTFFFFFGNFSGLSSLNIFEEDQAFHSEPDMPQDNCAHMFKTQEKSVLTASACIYCLNLYLVSLHEDARTTFASPASELISCIILLLFSKTLLLKR